MKIENYIPEGYQNRIGRVALSQRTGMCDRNCREAIEVSEEVIINMNGGYFKPTASEEDQRYLELYIRQERARIKSLVIKLQRIKKGRVRR